jgi:hypothetical protein
LSSGTISIFLNLRRILADAVVDDDRVVQRIAYDCQQGRDDVQVELELGMREETKDDRDVVEERT